MNVTDYTYLINKPYAINERQFQELDQILESFPFFQSARILRLKHLYNQDSFRYNSALKVTAAFTADRSVLFDFITSDNFTTIDNQLYDKKVAELLNLNVVDMEIVEYENSTNPIPNKLEDALRTAIHHSGEPLFDAAAPEENTPQNSPLEFNANEKHSFQEWLQLARWQPIDRIETPLKIEENTDQTTKERQKKQDLIDKFITSNPKIPALSKDLPPVTIPVENEDKSYLMTETLARVYLDQKKYQRAIQAYEILILKYPEKSSFFADRIEEIKIIQQNNI